MIKLKDLILKENETSEFDVSDVIDTSEDTGVGGEPEELKIKELSDYARKQLARKKKFALASVN